MFTGSRAGVELEGEANLMDEAEECGTKSLAIIA